MFFLLAAAICHLLSAAATCHLRSADCHLVLRLGATQVCLGATQMFLGATLMCLGATQICLRRPQMRLRRAQMCLRWNQISLFQQILKFRKILKIQKIGCHQNSTRECVSWPKSAWSRKKSKNPTGQGHKSRKSREFRGSLFPSIEFSVSWLWNLEHLILGTQVVNLHIVPHTHFHGTNCYLYPLGV